MEISPLQSIQIFGVWDQPRRILTWEDIKEKCLTWKMLRTEYNFSAETLAKLQPDKSEWISRGALTLHVLPEMTMFPINPFTDLGADIGELWSMKFSPEQLHSMGVTYAQMLSRGLTPQIMKLFGFSLSAWVTLGLRAKQINEWPSDYCSMVFGMDKNELINVLSNFTGSDTGVHNKSDL